MGKKFFDSWTIMHGLSGIIAGMTIYPNNLILGVLIGNIIHLTLEIAEKNINPHTGDILESFSNHIGDIGFFLIGSLLGAALQNYADTHNTWFNMKTHPTARYILLFIIIVCYIIDLSREIFPYHTWFSGSNGAYTQPYGS